MLRECTADLRELAGCRDCYRYSQETPCEKYWFCKPCRPFHELVYAKQKGFPYWPAKIIREENDEGLLEVRFFGGYHQKAMVEKQHIRPISINIHALQVRYMYKPLKVHSPTIEQNLFNLKNFYWPCTGAAAAGLTVK